ncbi:hypothetical protein FKM82_027338, partial [Ascaphus truei]
SDPCLRGHTEVTPVRCSAVIVSLGQCSWSICHFYLQVPADEVCGCPMVKDVFELTGDFCRVPKRKCNRHYCWEKLRRAEVDLERVRVWYKLDELFEQERNVRMAMTNRAGLLALMLHQTIQHDPVATDLRTHTER